MGACACKKAYNPAYNANITYPPSNYNVANYGSTSNSIKKTKPKTTIQPSAIKEALALQEILRGRELDEYVQQLAKHYVTKKIKEIPFKEYQRIMNGFESGVVPPIGGKTWVKARVRQSGLQITKEKVHVPTEEEVRIPAPNALLDALQQMAGGWKVKQMQHKTNETARYMTVETETKEEEEDEPKPFCFHDSYKRKLTACPDGCTLEAVEGLAELSTYKTDPLTKVKVPKAFLKTLRKELRSLKKSLLLTPENSMFVRYDEDRPQFMRAVITGNSDSPYAHGAFLFDIFLPANYPAVPPMIKHITPGATEVHANNGPGGFSPNMHQATGKICLSLLGTWAGPGWEAGKSNLYQVLSTICFAILSVDHPYYMEPNYGGWEGTAPTKNHEPKVIEYTEEVERGCVKFAMMGPLTKPYKFFEEVLATHFATKRLRIAQTIDRWTNATINLSHRRQLTTERKQLFKALWKVTQTAAKWDVPYPVSTK